ncbi:MAG: DUF2807 domain-containing protein [Bacteroidales bacterium]|nr:DUF2807 domain-containing protein [Bacteroidales bacterium]
MKRITLFLVFVFTLFTVNLFAQFGKKITGSNKYVHITHKVDAYNKLLISNVKANIVYFNNPDSVGFVRIYGEDNIVDLLEVGTQKMTLRIKTKGMKSNEHGLLMIYVYSSDIQTIDLTGGVIFETSDPMKQKEMKLAISGDSQIKIPNLECDKLKISLIGGGDVLIGGKSSEASYSLVGNGEIRADKFKVQTLSTKLIGNGNIGCNVSKLLRVTITGVGNIYYRGAAEIKSTIIGTGNVRKLD